MVSNDDRFADCLSTTRYLSNGKSFWATIYDGTNNRRIRGISIELTWKPSSGRKLLHSLHTDIIVGRNPFHLVFKESSC